MYILMLFVRARVLFEGAFSLWVSLNLFMTNFFMYVGFTRGGGEGGGGNYLTPIFRLIFADGSIFIFYSFFSFFQFL